MAQFGRFLVARLVHHIGANLIFEMPIIAVQHGPQRGFDGVALSDLLQDSQHIAHTVVIPHIFGSCERLILCQAGLNAIKRREAAFQ